MCPRSSTATTPRGSFSRTVIKASTWRCNDALELNSWASCVLASLNGLPVFTASGSGAAKEFCRPSRWEASSSNRSVDKYFDMVVRREEYVRVKMGIDRELHAHAG